MSPPRNRREACAQRTHYDTEAEASAVQAAKKAESAARGESVRHWRKRFCTLHGKWLMYWEHNRDGDLKGQRQRREERKRQAAAAAEGTANE